MSEEGKMRLAILDALNGHPGKKIIDRLHGFNATNAILWGNERELIKLIRMLEDPGDPLMVMGLENRNLLEEKFTEVYRLLHNFLASAATLVDHTRRMIEQTSINAAHKFEHARDLKSTFESDPLSRFVKDLRNYVMHRDKPSIMLTLHIEGDSTRNELLLRLDSMLSWPKWSSPARDFIESKVPNIRICEFVEPYAEKVHGFGKEFVNRFSKYYSEEIEGAYELAKQWNAGITL